MLKRGIVIGFMTLLFSAFPAHADSVLLGTGATWNGASFIIDSGHTGAQQFTLTSTIQVTGVNVLMALGTFGTAGTIQIQLTNAICAGLPCIQNGPPTQANVLAQGTWTSSAVVPNTTVLSWAPLSTNLVLGPGTYYLVVSSGDASIEWTMPSPILASTVGSVGSRYSAGPSSVNTQLPPASLFVGGGGTMGFEIVGNANPVPEPATLLLVSSGLAAGWLRRRRKS
ncbi:MAG: PEP-CTERM sorting domain-containing protein [Acidobacteria bacterium]|nr:PEP-CTERM sorting domain-containing protein [Acidobacteriota bacterium]MCL5286858.1 PEP-CTERM sorting domain-containing protein [Acidobacteriota bacterium]